MILEGEIKDAKMSSFSSNEFYEFAKYMDCIVFVITLISVVSHLFICFVLLIQGHAAWRNLTISRPRYSGAQLPCS